MTAEAEPMTADELARKVRWEGGLMAALEYGIRPEDIADPELGALWERLRKTWAEVEPLLDELVERLDVQR